MSRTKLQPIKGKKKFDALFKEGVRFKGRDSLALVKFKEDNSSHNPSLNRIIFYAVAVSKKTAKKAVVRNRLKRLMRESLRQLIKEDETLFENIEYIILLWEWAPKHPKLIHLKEVKQTVEQILMNIKVFKSNKEV